MDVYAASFIIQNILEQHPICVNEQELAELIKQQHPDFNLDNIYIALVDMQVETETIVPHYRGFLANAQYRLED